MPLAKGQHLPVQFRHVVHLRGLRGQLHRRLILHDPLTHGRSVRVGHRNDIYPAIEVIALYGLLIIGLIFIFVFRIITDDASNQNELLASKFDIEGMRKFINATTLQFLSIEGLYKSMGYEKRNSSYPQFTDHCFTGEYPIKPIDAHDKDFINDQPSLMSSKY